MNTIVIAAAIVLMVLQGIDVVALPFMFGRPRKPLSPATWLVGMFVMALITIVCGSVFGWWGE